MTQSQTQTNELSFRASVDLMFNRAASFMDLSPKYILSQGIAPFIQNIKSLLKVASAILLMSIKMRLKRLQPL